MLAAGNAGQNGIADAGGAHSVLPSSQKTLLVPVSSTYLKLTASKPEHLIAAELFGLFGSIKGRDIICAGLCATEATGSGTHHAALDSDTDTREALEEVGACGGSENEEEVVERDEPRGQVPWRPWWGAGTWRRLRAGGPSIFGGDKSLRASQKVSSGRTGMHNRVQDLASRRA